MQERVQKKIVSRLYNQCERRDGGQARKLGVAAIGHPRAPGSIKLLSLEIASGGDAVERKIEFAASKRNESDDCEAVNTLRMLRRIERRGQLPMNAQAD